MARVLGLWFWVTTAALAALVLNLFIDLFIAIIPDTHDTQQPDLTFTPRIIAVAVGLVILGFFAPPIRRFLWQLPILGTLLQEHVFEDIDGDWVVQIESNWPIIHAMLQASSGKSTKPFDPVSRPEDVPDLALVNLEATIKIGWERSKATFHPSALTPLLTSRTIVFELIRRDSENPARIFWGFKQTNENINATDEDNFLGAAMLEVVSTDHLEGVYWNNRSWRLGLNAAGRIRMRRKTPPPNTG